MANPEKSTVRRSYQQTMRDTRQELSPVERAWSHLVHNPVVALVGPALSQSILRPRPLLVGSWLALVSLAGAYLLERLHGYAVSGAEPLLGFGVGWLIGLGYSIFVTVAQNLRLKR